MFKELRSHKIYVPLITVAVSAGLFFIYYFFYVSSQRSYANERAFRLLSVVSDQLAQRNDNLKRVFAAALVSPKDAEVYLTERVPDLKGKISHIKVTPGCPPIQNRDGDLTLRLNDKPGSFSVGAEFHPAKIEHCSVSGDVDLKSDLSERFRNITEEYFDDILIASSAGEVLFQKNVSALRITNLNALLPPKAAEKKDEKDPPPKTAFQDASQFTNVIDVKLGGTDYKLYIQPVPLFVQGPGNQNLKPIVCGLWRADRLQSEVVSIPYSVLIWGTLIVLSIFALVWPLLKVAYMSPSERLRRKHVFYLLFSALLVTTMLTVIVLNLSYSLRADEESGEQLDALAERIDRNVRAELSQALAFLDALGRDEQFVHARFRKVTSSAWTAEEFLKSNFFDNPAIPYYPYFDNAFWFDTAGQQQYKITVQAKATPRTPVRDSVYFQDVKHGRLLKVADTTYSFTSLYSPNTAEFFVVLAKPYKTPKEWSDLPPPLRDLSGQVLVTRFLCLIDPIVPAGFGFAVVDHDGIVQFHSSSARNQIEDFFKESRQDPALKSLVRNGASDHLSVNYLGKRQEMAVRPMPYLATPALSLIVFRDSNYFTTVNVACILVLTLLLALYGLPFLVALAIYVSRRRDYPLENLWPSTGEIPKYVNVIAANVCVTAAFAIRFPSMKMNETLVAVVAITAAVVFFNSLKPARATGKLAWLYKAPVLLAILAVARGGAALLVAGLYIVVSLPRISEFLAARATQFKVKHVYLCVVLSLMIVLSVLPCFGLFKISYDTVNRLALESAQIARRDQLVHRTEQVEKYFQDLNAKSYVKKRIKESLDRYDEPVFYPENLKVAQGTRRDVSWLERSIALAGGWFPSNRLGAELRERATSDSGDADQWSAAEDGDHVLLRLAGIPKEADPSGELLGAYPRLRLPFLATALMALLAIVLACWLNYVIRKVFLTDMEDVPQLKQWAPGEPGRRSLVIVGHPKSGKSSQAAALPNVDMLDLAKAVTTGNWSPPALVSPTVVVDHFEFDIDNPDTCLAKLKLLENLLYVERKRVILLSAVDPMFYLAASSPEIVTPTGAGHEPPVQLLDRWAAVISQFDRRKIEDISEKCLSRFGAGEGKECREELVKMVKSECDHTAQLRKIGRAMLKEHCYETPMSKAQFVEELLDRADSYYRVLWSTCTKGERLVLFQLAQDGWANPKNERALQQLQRRRIVRRGSGFRIMNDSFCRFVRTAQAPDEVKKWDEEEENSAWSAVKLGLSTALMMFGAWLLYAQQDVFQLGIGYLAALGTASGAVLNLVKNLTGRGDGGKAGAKAE